MRPSNVVLKIVVWIAALSPQAWLMVCAATGTLGPSPEEKLASTTGLAALWLLAATLSLTPLRRLSSRLSGLMGLRRLLGLFAFYYASLHLLLYLALFLRFNPAALIADFSRRSYILAGIFSWSLLVLLAATSTQAAIRRLGGRNWKRLHKLIYLAAAGAVLHFWWKAGDLAPLPLTLLLLALMAARLVRKRKPQPESR
jgi:sulfoxide reductase heme-binding subunit YedZ